MFIYHLLLITFSMFFIDPTFLKIVVIVAGIAVAVFGLTFLTLRRRAEILDNYFTPDEDGLEEEFFRRRAQRQHDAQDQAAKEEADAQLAAPEDEWGNHGSSS